MAPLADLCIPQAGLPTEDEDDILAAFNASAPVDRSSHFPVPSSQNGTQSHNTSRAQSTQRQGSLPFVQPQAPSAASNSLFDVEDNDPFGLRDMPQRPTGASQGQTSMQDDDDVLGLLGQPVESTPRPAISESKQSRRAGKSQPSGMDDPRDKAIAELVDMGFDPDRSRMALEHTGNGIDVQGAVSWLLNQAHEEARSRSRIPNGSSTAQSDIDVSRQPQQQRRADDRSGSRVPAWLQPNRPNRADNTSPNTGEKDVSQVASDLGNQVWKSANSLWRTGQKKMQKAVAGFQQPEPDGSQPKWMREAEMRQREAEQSKGKARAQETATDEAMMLEAGNAPPSRRPGRRPEQQLPEPRPPQPQRQGSVMREATLPARAESKPTQKLSRQAVEEESSQAYISPARRKKPAPTPELKPTQEPTRPSPAPAPIPAADSLDIFSDAAVPIRPKAPTTTKPSRPTQSGPVVGTPVAIRPKAAPRPTPPVSPIALQSSTSHRAAGTASFKRGDYASATTSYLAALTPLPPSHPIAILLHTNLALSHQKTGDSRAAIASADSALKLIGTSRGEGEAVDLGAEGSREMKDLYAKALIRKAEALEGIEKWSDAASVWRQAVEMGAGGAVAIQGRQRCEKAAQPQAQASSAPRPAPKRAQAPPRPKPSVLSSFDQPPSEAVTRLRAQNAASAAASDEAFALNDSITARIDAWKNGKEGNLRALLASLDTVLWAGANWTKVGMADLVMGNRVKVVYMRAIGRCHPDKVSFFFCVVCYLLFAVCCLLFTVYCLLWLGLGWVCVWGYLCGICWLITCID